MGSAPRAPPYRLFGAKSNRTTPQFSLGLGFVLVAHGVPAMPPGRNSNKARERERPAQEIIERRLTISGRKAMPGLSPLHLWWRIRCCRSAIYPEPGYARVG